MEDRIADWIDQVFEAVLKQNGIFTNSDLEELCDDFKNLYKTFALECDVAEGFEKLYKTMAMTVKYINSMILNLNDIIFSSMSG